MKILLATCNIRNEIRYSKYIKVKRDFLQHLLYVVGRSFATVGGSGTQNYLHVN